MCGICGIAARDSGRPVDRDRIERMCATIAHRGPDDTGVYLAPGVGLGHRRLSIVDLSTGHQPMASESDRIWIVFNGEIYNHAALRPALQAAGHRYRTASDTETILHLYEEHGPEGFRALQGMFAFAVWDEDRRTLVLARDHSGIKPLYYATTAAGDLVFGSEVKALAAGGADLTLDHEVLPEYFATGHVSGERTLLRGVRKLLPGHWLTWTGGTLRTGAFWRLEDAAGPPAGRDDRDIAGYAEEFWRRFVDSVTSQLMSDVPLGAFLSGGLDSSLMIAAMTQAGVREIETFSVGYADREANELPYAAAVARAFGTRHHEVTLSPEEFLGDLPRLTWHRDFPLTFAASIPLAAVSRSAAGRVKVVLTGEGSDELFAGYGRYPRALLNLRWGRRLDRWLPGPARRALASGARRAGDGYLGSRLRRSFLAQPGTFEGSYLEAFSEFGAADRVRLLGNGSDAFDQLSGLTDPRRFLEQPLETMLRFDQATYLEELLMKQDTMSMAASIESRVPFLDHTLREWAARLPPESKLDSWTGKALVRKAAAAHLPREIIEAKKRGFPVPLARWFRLPEGRAMLERYAAHDQTEAGIRPDYPRRLLAEHRAGRDHSSKLWRVMAFGVWWQDTLPRLRRLAREPAVSVG